MAKAARSLDIVTPPFLVAFAHVWEPRAFEGEPEDKAKYGVSMVFDADADIAGLKAAASKVARDQWGDNLPAEMKNPFLDAGAHSQHEGFEPGGMFIRATSQRDRPPGVVGPDTRPITVQSDFYSGCRAGALVNFYAWERRTGCGVSCGLIHLQKIADGDPLGSSAPKPADVFSAVGAPSAADMFDL